MRTYLGLAGALLELLEKIQVSQPVVIGWSLGGHIAIEFFAPFRDMRALQLCGTAPVGELDGKNNMAEGFNSPPTSILASDRAMDEREARSFVDRVFRGTGKNVLVEAAMRTAGRFRRRLLESSLEGSEVNQKSTVEAARLPISIVNGADDDVIKTDFFRKIMFQNPWEDTVHEIVSAGHAPFWEKPMEFNRILRRFLPFASKSIKGR